MPIDWNDNKKRKAFREALQGAYPSLSALKIFFDEGLNINTSLIAGQENLQVEVFDLLQWAKANNRLDEVYAVFKEENPDHPVIRKLELQDLVVPTSNLAQADWNELFQQFSTNDLADLQRAFNQGFVKVFGLSFQQVQPRSAAIAHLDQIRELLELYDADTKGPVLAIRFVECAIAQIQRSSEGTNRDLTLLEQWRDRIAQKFGVSLDTSDPDQKHTIHAYLLVALEVSAGSEVIVYPELHIAGRETPVPFAANNIRCPIDQVTEPIAQWIQQAEDTLEESNYQFDEIVLEIFLPCRYLEEDIATAWKIKNHRNDEIDFGNHRKFLVRSLDRVHNRIARRILKQRWADLEARVKANTVNGAFHLQDCCPTKKGDLLATLKDCKAPGLKFVASLPTDGKQRADLLYDIIDASVPIALWVADISEGELNNFCAETLCTEFNTIIDCQLTNFTALATQWRIRRRESSLSTAIRLLCDRPDRFPNLPDPERDEDALSFAS